MSVFHVTDDFAWAVVAGLWINTGLALIARGRLAVKSTIEIYISW